MPALGLVDLSKTTACCIPHRALSSLKVPLHSKMNVHNDAYARFDTERLFSLSSAESEKFHCAH